MCGMHCGLVQAGDDRDTERRKPASRVQDSASEIGNAQGPRWNVRGNTGMRPRNRNFTSLSSSLPPPALGIQQKQTRACYRPLVHHDAVTCVRSLYRAYHDGQPRGWPSIG